MFTVLQLPPPTHKNLLTYLRLDFQLNCRDWHGTTAGSHGRLLKRDSTRSHITASSSERMIEKQAPFHCPWSTKEASHTSWLRKMLADMKSLELTESLIHSLNWWVSTWPTQSRIIYITNSVPPAHDPPQTVSVMETMTSIWRHCTLIPRPPLQFVLTMI